VEAEKARTLSEDFPRPDSTPSLFMVIFPDGMPGTKGGVGSSSGGTSGSMRGRPGMRVLPVRASPDLEMSERHVLLQRYLKWPGRSSSLSSSLSSSGSMARRSSSLLGAAALSGGARPPLEIQAGAVLCHVV
jgi:hypothetical protein